jgi:hypothetical protein
MVSAAVACLPTAVSLLLLEALFMQISGVSLALTWPCRLCLLRFLLCVSLCQKLSPFQALGKVTLHPRSQACVFIYSSCGKWVFPPLLWSFPPTTTFTSFPAPDYWALLLLLPATMFVYSSRGKWVPSSPVEFSSLCHSHQLSHSWFLGTCPTPSPTRASPTHPACLFTVLGRIPFLQSSALSALHPLSCVSYLFLLLITQFLFFLQVEVSLSRGLCCSGPGLSVGVLRYREAHLVRVFPSRLGASDWWPGSPPGFSV